MVKKVRRRFLRYKIKTIIQGEDVENFIQKKTTLLECYRTRTKPTKKVAIDNH